jgi:hypothetical protein
MVTTASGLVLYLLGDRGPYGGQIASNVVVELVAGDPCLCRRPEGNTASRFTGHPGPTPRVRTQHNTRIGQIVVVVHCHMIGGMSGSKAGSFFAPPLPLDDSLDVHRVAVERPDYPRIPAFHDHLDISQHDVQRM